jgi:4-hydroxy-tetrahydrodipicolinate synthase
LPETVMRLCELPQIVALKEASGSAQRASQVIARAGDRLAVLSGDDVVAFPLFALGARGVISVVSNVAPADMSAMWDAAAAGDWSRARALHYKLLPLSEGLFVETNPIPTKAALAMMGRIADELRPPLYPLAGAHREKLRAALVELKLL